MDADPGASRNVAATGDAGDTEPEAGRPSPSRTASPAKPREHSARDAEDGPLLSLVIPAYDEAARIADPLRTIDAYLAAQPYSCEIVVVDDGSRDDTVEVVRALAPELATTLRLFRSTPNRGKGYGLKVGFDKARGERILFADADLSTPIEETGAMMAALDAGHPIAIGSRKMRGANIEIHQPFVREQLGKVFTALVRALIAEVSDATCGFKAFRRDVGKALFARVRVFDWSFDAEILCVAKLRGIPIHEVPVHWQDREGSKVNLRRDIINSLIGIARIRLNALRGRYATELAIDGVEEVPIPAAARATPNGSAT